VQFDFDINGILHVAAVDRGSGKQAGMRVSAARARLSAAEISSSRQELDDLMAEVLDLEDDELDDEHIIEQDAEQTAPAQAGAGSNLEMLGLLARARRAVALAGDNTGVLRDAIAALQDALGRNDATDIVARSDALLDLLYELDVE
jgi:molecular chaperone DnaK (HSP70)